MKSNLSLLLLLFSLSIVGCQSTPPAPEPEEPKVNLEKVVATQIEESHEKLRVEMADQIRRILRNEILPEVREITTYSKNIRKKQVQAKSKALEKTVIGRVEWIETKNPEVRFRARVDTGAQTNSMHAENIVEQQINGKPYVEFTTTDEEGTPHTFLKEVVKETKVRGTSGKAEKRYVIKMQFRFAGKDVVSNVNLNNRSKLRHGFLIGRNLLLGNYVVDVSQSRLVEEK